MATKRVCRCGELVCGPCPHCHKPQQAKKTAERGYDNRWRRLSERKRATDPLCEHCLKSDRITPAEHVHHIESIASRPDLRLVWSNLMSVCADCHREIENE